MDQLGPNAAIQVRTLAAHIKEDKGLAENWQRETSKSIDKHSQLYLFIWILE